MRKFLLLFIVFTAPLFGYSQTQKVDSLMEVISELEGKTNALDERVLLNETDLGKLTKIKISGYIQAQWEMFGEDLEKALGTSNTAYVRRARIKFTYEPLDGVKFVLQPDFSTGNLALKDAYAVINIPKLQGWSLWAGQMNRTNYEVEYSSSQREVMERSRVIRTLYPGEREIGLKLEYLGIKIPVKFQMMGMNGNFTGLQQKDADSGKDLMTRLVYSLKLPGSGIGIDFGPNVYYGRNLSKTNKYIKESDGTLDSLDRVWTYMDKKWVGGEMQIFADLLGGTSIKAEYIAGLNSTPSTVPANATRSQMLANPSLYNNFSGYYLYLIKNIGQKNQFVARYDYYDPNTKLSGDEAGSSIYYKTWTLAWQYYMNDNIRISMQYEMPENEINASNPTDRKDNTFTIRVQAKF
jgi:phosphate-selective porin